MLFVSIVLEKIQMQTLNMEVSTHGSLAKTMVYRKTARNCLKADGKDVVTILSDLYK